ncbi:FAS1 domain-containing protein [Trematosphaeria pertusa]|uniref:FAS1 domain-containing protein n=1 Tax=Trematosphaeria pertusa TaxID=390896 RepID=A0A6A6I5T4_9PLEO|nr:FAS1 domain-containing protein [Trematosphaeria pertusa]KAF2245312.1 FAS1 domain-containing protein [Trematosphaeria pertusa]
MLSHGRIGTSEFAERTIWATIERIPRFSLFAALLNEHHDIRARLNSTHQMSTLFIPTNDAIVSNTDFSRSGPHERCHGTLEYHIVPWPLSTTNLFCTPTLPTQFHPNSVNGPQRLKVDIRFTGPIIDGRAKVEYPDIAASNGYIHAIDTVLQPPSLSTLSSIMHMPKAQFGTFIRALHHSGIITEVNGMQSSGLTAFAPSNRAFDELGEERIRHLFTPEGRGELKMIVASHFVLNKTLYSNAYYVGRGRSLQHLEVNLCARGTRHFKLETLQPDVSHKVTVFRFARLIEMAIDDFTFVAHKDIVAKDGVLHVVHRLLSR